MKKVKITVLKTTLDEELVKEYGAEGLKACPMLKAGQVFYADYAKPRAFAMRPGKRSTNMFLRFRMERVKHCFIMATGSENPG